jgi:hypothetical protein
MPLKAPTTWADDREHRRRIASLTNRLVDGQSNNAGTFTLTPSAATTTVSDPRAGRDSVVVWMPTSSTAAADVGSMYVSGRTQGTFTITHANSAQSSRVFEYALIGTGRTET